MMLSKKRVDEENEELGKLREEISEWQKLADASKNYYREMIKCWIIGIAIILVTIIVAILLGFLISGMLPYSMPESERNRILFEIKNMVPFIFSATLTANGVIIGFVPACSFFFLREIREDQHELEHEWKEEKKTKEDEGERWDLISTIYALRSVILHNLRSGVKKYTRTYVFVSIFLQVYTVFFYATMSVYGMAPLFIMIEIIFLMVIFFGLLPVIYIALYQPALRLVRIGIVEKEFIGIVPED